MNDNERDVVADELPADAEPADETAQAEQVGPVQQAMPSEPVDEESTKQSAQQNYDDWKNREALELSRVKTQLLHPNNKFVRKAGLSFGWKPETVLSRMERALPSVLEQILYLRVGVDFRLMPETFSKILREYLGVRELQLVDLKPLGNTESKFDETVRFLASVLSILDKESLDYPGSGVSTLVATRIAKRYGPDHVIHILDSVMTNLDAIREFLGFRSASDDRMFGIAMSFLAYAIMDDDNASWDDLSVMEYFENPSRIQEWKGWRSERIAAKKSRAARKGGS